MKIVIAGSTGLIGEALFSHLVSEGHLVKRLVRLNKLEEGILWDPTNKKVTLSELEGFDAFINLAGENIANARWSAEKKRKIKESRLQATTFLVETVLRLQNPPKVFLNASAIGFYDHEGRGVSECALPGNGFLAEVCRSWEGALDPLLKSSIRSVFLRFGIVLSKKGGLFLRLCPPLSGGLAV